MSFIAIFSDENIFENPDETPESQESKFTQMYRYIRLEYEYFCRNIGILIFSYSMGAYYTNTSKKVGSEQDFDVVRTIYHPDYNAESPYNNDIALLQLHKNVVHNFKVNFACLPKSGSDFPPGTMCYLAGWGDLESGGDDPDHMMHVQVPIVSNAKCTANGSYHESLVTSKMLCAGYKEGGKDTCQGDSGGPLMCSDGYRWHIVGATSWGYGCALPDYYGVYARVGNFIDWIASAVQSIGQSTSVV